LKAAFQRIHIPGLWQ